MNALYYVTILYDLSQCFGTAYADHHSARKSQRLKL